MRTWIALIVVLAAIAAGLIFGLGLLRDEPETQPVDETGGRAAVSPGEEGRTEVPPALQPAPGEPKDLPPLEAAPVADPIGVLLLVGVPQRFNLFLAQQIQSHPKMTVTSWATPLPEGHPGAPEGKVLPGALSAPPRRSTLDDKDIDVVIVHDLDPSLVDRDLWLEVVKRVEDGRLGLLVVPGSLHGQAMLDNDVLATVLPVAKATPIAGDPVPGTFGAFASYVVTDEGTRHPASRLVSWPGWSSRIWTSRSLLATPWGTGFCYPVEEVPVGASVLLKAKPPAGEALPALIAGPPERGRVLWFGGWDLGGRAAYGRPDVVTDWQVLVRNWVAWLSGQVED